MDGLASNLDPADLKEFQRVQEAEGQKALLQGGESFLLGNLTNISTNKRLCSNQQTHEYLF
jgi:hypothetical protein